MQRSSIHPLRQAREAKNLTLQALADAVGLSEKTIWSAEHDKPVGFYTRKKLCKYFKKTAQELGLVLDSKKAESTALLDQKQEAEYAESTKIAPLEHSSKGEEALSTFTNRVIQDILPVVHEPGGKDLDPLRRQVFHGILNTACATLVLSPYAFFHSHETIRITSVVTNNLSLDEETLSDLEVITQRYWRLSKNTSLDLFSGVVGHFETVIYLIKRSHPRHMSRRLYSLVGEIAQIFGKMLFDIHEYSLAWSYYTISLQAAQTAHNHDLRAVGLGRLGLLAIYNNQLEEAQIFLEEGQTLPIQGARTRAWLTAVTAEAQSHLDDFDASKALLDTAEQITTEQQFEEDMYATGFNESRLFGYKGACFSHLGKAELALPSLQKALALIDPSAIRRQSTILADIGLVYAQLGDMNTAYTYASQALAITAQTRSLSVLQRLHTLQSILHTQNSSGTIKDFDQQLRDLDQQIVAAKASVIS